MSIRPDRTLFAALHGEVVPHPWRDPLVVSSDTYSLFVARSSALGWLADTTARTSGGVWGMNDAGQYPVTGSQLSQITWFQVSLTEPVAVGRPLPVQAFLSCAHDVVARVGRLRLQAAQILLPAQNLDASAGTPSRAGAVGTLVQDSGWFVDGDPRRRTPVRVTVDGGQDQSVRLAAHEMLQWIRTIQQVVFSCDSLSMEDEDDYDQMLREPAVIDELWLGPAQHRVTFHGVLAEWSLDALGWLAAFLAEVSSLHGVSTPLLLTIHQSDR